MIVTVTPNPALDLTWHVDRILPGGTHRADTGVARAGGKGLNVARVVHAEGAAVRAVATRGGTTGAEFADELASSGTPHVLVPVQAATRRSIALVDEHLGDTTVVNERGLNPTAVEWEALRAAVRRALGEDDRGSDDRGSDGRDETRRSDGERPSSRFARSGTEEVRSSGSGGPEAGHPVLVISGSLPPGSPDDLLPSLIRIGRDVGAVVVVDTSGPALLEAAMAGASVLKPNAMELAEATGIPDPLSGACVLLDRGAKLVLLSQGADGMLAITADEIVRARLAAPLAGNPTGAGDAAVAACAVLLAQGETDPETLLRRATAWSAAAVLMPLAGEIHDSWPALEAALIVDRPAVTELGPSVPTAPRKDLR